MATATLLLLLVLAPLAWQSAAVSGGATLEDLSDTEKLALIDCLPMRSPLATAVALCPGLEKHGRQYDEHYEVGTSLFGRPATLWCDFRAGCLFQLLFEIRSFPAHEATEAFQSAVAQFGARHGVTETIEERDAEEVGLTASWCTDEYGLTVSCSRGEPAEMTVVYQYWCAGNPEGVRSWKDGWSCEEPSD